jgi:hypothetical protein
MRNSYHNSAPDFAALNPGYACYAQPILRAVGQKLPCLWRNVVAVLPPMAAALTPDLRDRYGPNPEIRAPS